MTKVRGYWFLDMATIARGRMNFLKSGFNPLGGASPGAHGATNRKNA
jgi:hypothetical protein